MHIILAHVGSRKSQVTVTGRCSDPHLARTFLSFYKEDTLPFRPSSSGQSYSYSVTKLSNN
jgi:hypothetical protein